MVNPSAAVAAPGVKTKGKIAQPLHALQRLGDIFTTGTRNPYRDAAVSDSQMNSIGVLPSRRLNIEENALGLS